jgi:hypothetical protein
MIITYMIPCFPVFPVLSDIPTMEKCYYSSTLHYLHAETANFCLHTTLLNPDPEAMLVS